MKPVVIVFFAFLYVLFCSTSCLAFTFIDCGSILGKFTEVSVSGCQQSDEKCTLVRGTNASISIKFTPNKDISQVNVHIYGVVFDASIPFPFDKSDACKDPEDGVDCPLHQNQEYHYSTAMFVQKKFPKVSVDIKWELVNEDKEKIVCIQFPAKLK